MRTTCRAFWRARRGNAATEFAFILPILLLFIGGIVEFGRVFQAYSAVDALATRYAITYADCFDNPAPACNTELQTLFAPTAGATIGMQNLAPQLTNTASLQLRMFEVSMPALPAAQVPTIVYASPAGTTTLLSDELAKAQATIAPGKLGVIASVSYVHKVLFFASFVPAALQNRSIIYTVAQRKN